MIKKVPQLLPLKQKIRFVRYLPLLWFLNRLKKETNYSFARKLKSPFLREAFELLFDGDELPLMIITIPLAFGDLKASAYPVGGASVFVSSLVKKYLSLGGQIQYHSPVNSILLQGDCATGIQFDNGNKVFSDIVFSAADWHFTVFQALGGRYVNKTILELGSQKKLKVYYSLLLVFIC